MISKPKVALIAEDELLIRLIAVEMFLEAGFQVIEASNAEEALDILKRQSTEIDLLFTDINMPGRMDGLNLAHQAHVVRPETAVLITSGGRRPLACEMPEGSRFLPKPYVTEQIMTQIRTLIAA